METKNIIKNKYIDYINGKSQELQDRHTVFVKIGNILLRVPEAEFA